MIQLDDMDWIWFPYTPTEDKNITCVICGKGPCEYEIVLRDATVGTTVWKGLHKKCLEGHQKYMKWWQITHDE